MTDELIFFTAERTERLTPIYETLSAGDADSRSWSTGDSRLIDWINAADDLVTRYLNGGTAPASVVREAIFRVVGYLTEAPQSPIAVETLGSSTTHWNTGQISPLRHSGAMAILSPFKARGGAIARGSET